MENKNPESAVVKHETIYRGKIVNLYVDTVELDSGANAIREVVEHPGGAVAIPVLDDGKLVLVRQFRYPLQKYILEFPAGKLDGRSPLETIINELAEEAGCRAETLTHECSFYTSPGISTEIVHLFVARNLTPVASVLEEGEHITVETYTPEECFQMIYSGEIRDAKSILGFLWYAAKFGVM
jgi:ADP-ribose pyrophosphatase